MRLKRAANQMIAAALVGTMMLTVSACSTGNKPTQNPTASATEATKEAISVDLSEIHEAVKKVYGADYIPSFQYDEQSLEDLFGIKKDLYENYIAEGPMISVNIDNFIAIEAKEGKAQEVETLLKKYQETLQADAMQYPMNLVKIQASEVILKGNYVFFVMLGTPSMESEEEGEEAALASAKENNQKAVDVIHGFFQ